MRILILEAEQDLTRALGGAKPYEIAPLSDPDVFKNLASSYSFLVIDTDTLGDQAAAFIANLRDARIHTPILIVGHENNPDTTAAMLNAGADRYLPKPVRPEILAADILALERLIKRSDHEKIEVGNNIVIDCTSQTARVKGRQMSLTPAEYQVLECLARAKGQPVKPEDIVKKLTSKPTKVLLTDSSEVDTLIARLRKAIAQNNGGAHHILTMRNVGYMLVEKPTKRIYTSPLRQVDTDEAPRLAVPG